MTPTPVAPSPTPSIAPEQTTPAPIAPTPTPVPAPASTQEVPKVTQKTEPINYNTSVGREQDIQKNISEITK